MKKETKKAKAPAKKSTKKTSASEQPVINMNITNTSTYNGMINSVIIAKAEAGLDISSDEFMFVMTNAFDMCASIISKNRGLVTGMTALSACFLNDLIWEHRPWYKKLIFWKKKPEFKLEF